MATTQVTKVFRPDAVGAEDNWVLLKGSDKVSAVDPGDPINHDDAGSRIRNADLSTDKQSFTIDREFPESMGTVVALRVHYRAKPQIANGSIKVSVFLTDTWGASSTIDLGAAASYSTGSATLANPKGGSWTETNLRDTTFRFAVEPDTGAVPDIIDVTSLWVEVDYQPTDESGGAIPPEFPGRKLRRSRLPLGVLEAEMRADVLDVDLLEDFEVIHSEGETLDGNGWTEDAPRHFRCIGSELDLNTMKVRVKAIDLHDYACMFWHTGISPYNVRSDEEYADGPAILHPGATETFTRPSKAWIKDSGDRIAELSSDNKRYGPYGIMLEGGATNRVINSAFFNGWTEWTRSSTTQTSLDNTELLFYDDVATGYNGTNQTAKLEFVTGVGSASVSQLVGDSINGGDVFAIAVWHKDSSTCGPKIRVHSTSHQMDYNYTTDVWFTSTAGPTLNAIAHSTSNWESDTELITNTTTAGNIELWVYAPFTGGTCDAHTNVGQVELEWTPDGHSNIGSPIPTFTSAITREADSLKFSSNSGRRLWPEDEGTLLVRARFGYDGPITVLAPTTQAHDGVPLIVLHYNSNNWAALSYDTSNEELAFSVMAGGNLKRATTTFSPVEDQTYDVACRWLPSGGKFDLAGRTLSIFKDGTKGTDIQQTTDIAADSSGALYIGSGPSGFGGNSRISEPGIEFSNIEILPFALSSGEINQRP